MVEGRALATDGVVVLDDEIVLLKRDHPPHEGKWVLPGGQVESDETAAEACAREVHEEVGLRIRPVSFIDLYDDPGRDERGNVSAAYLCVPREEVKSVPQEEARHVETFPPEDFPPLGFDHATILADALDPR